MVHTGGGSRRLVIHGQLGDRMTMETHSRPDAAAHSGAAVAVNATTVTGGLRRSEDAAQADWPGMGGPWCSHATAQAEGGLEAGSSPHIEILSLITFPDPTRTTHR